MMLTCKEVTRLLSEAHERRLVLREQLALRAHLLICRGCANFRRQLAFLQRATRRYLGRDDPESP